jgi:hypothetical protein
MRQTLRKKRAAAVLIAGYAVAAAAFLRHPGVVAAAVAPFTLTPFRSTKTDNRSKIGIEPKRLLGLSSMR